VELLDLIQVVSTQRLQEVVAVPIVAFKELIVASLVIVVD